VQTVLRMLLPALALLLLAAHFFRGGLFPLAAISFGLIALLPVSRPWAALLLRAALALGTVEWLRTAWDLAGRRALAGQPYTRLLLILGAVATLTVVAAWLAGRPVKGSSPGGRDV
jgi:hypothetical protein